MAQETAATHHMIDPTLIAALLGRACSEARALPRVIPQPQELPDFTPERVEARRREGWFGDGLATVYAGAELVSLVDVRVEGQQASLGWFATQPDHRRKGHAAGCLQHALQYAREQGATQVQTHSFIDSRLTAACAFLEHHGFTVRDPDHQNMVMQIDIDQYSPRPFELPEDYAIRSLRMEHLDHWLKVKDGVFDSTTTPEWFMDTFGSRFDFDPTGWLLLYYRDEPVGIAGADFHRDPARPDVISGCQIEYVGVLDEHRGRRLGEALMLACLDYTKRHDVQPCQLITQRFRTAAVTLYEKLGFRWQRDNRTYEKPL